MILHEQHFLLFLFLLLSCKPSFLHRPSCLLTHRHHASFLALFFVYRADGFLPCNSFSCSGPKKLFCRGSRRASSRIFSVTLISPFRCSSFLYSFMSTHPLRPVSALIGAVSPTS